MAEETFPPLRAFNSSFFDCFPAMWGPLSFRHFSRAGRYRCSPVAHGVATCGTAIKWRHGGDAFRRQLKTFFCLTVLTISYVDSYRDIDSYVTILPSLPTQHICGPCELALYKEKSAFLFQRLSVSIQRYNAILLQGCFVKEEEK